MTGERSPRVKRSTAQACDRAYKLLLKAHDKYGWSWVSVEHMPGLDDLRRQNEGKTTKAQERMYTEVHRALLLLEAHLPRGLDQLARRWDQEAAAQQH